ncbi:hypothetical protein Hanom_Chr10g00882351 [Helianthus anomalus]
MRLHVCNTRAHVRHVTIEPIRSHHTIVRYWLTLVRRTRHISVHAPVRADQCGLDPCTGALASQVMRHCAHPCACLPCRQPGPYSLCPYSLSSDSRCSKCKVRHQSDTLCLSPTPHARELGGPHPSRVH